MESVPGLLLKGLSYLLYIESDTTVLPVLIDWMIEALDESKAMAQPESAYKVRHLKMGFKVAGALCSCDSSIALQCLVSSEKKFKFFQIMNKFYIFTECLSYDEIKKVANSGYLHQGLIEVGIKKKLCLITDCINL